MGDGVVGRGGGWRWPGEVEFAAGFYELFTAAAKEGEEEGEGEGEGEGEDVGAVTDASAGMLSPD